MSELRRIHRIWTHGPRGSARRSLRRSLTVLSLAAVMLAVAACGSAQGSSTASSGIDLNGSKPLRPAHMTSVTILVATPIVDVSYAPYLVAKALGYFSRENLNVKIIPSTGSTNAIKEAAIGHVQFAHITPEPIMIGLQPGRNLNSKIVYTVVQHPIYEIVVPAASKIHSVTDLKGKRIGVVNLASATVVDIKALLKGAGINPATGAHIVAVGLGGSALEALKGGHVNALDMTDTQVAVLENLGLKLRVIPTPMFDKFPSAGLAVSDTFLRQHPRIIAAVGRAAAEGTVFTLANPKAAVLACWKAKPSLKPTGVPTAKALREQLAVLEARIPHLRLPAGASGYGYNVPSHFTAFAAYLKKAGVLKHAINPAQAYTNAFAKQYNLFNAASIRKQAATYSG